MKRLKNGLMAVLMLLPLAFGSCLNGSSSEPDPMAAAYSIYNAGQVKFQLTMVPADVALRLAVAWAEADKQGEDVLEVEDANGNRVLDLLFDPAHTQVSCEGTQYIFKFTYEQNLSNNFYDGTVVVETNGESLADSAYDKPWTASVLGLKSYVNTGYSSVAYTYSSNAATKLYYNDYTYEISVADFTLTASGSDMVAGWNGSFEMQTATLVFSEIKEETNDFKFYGSAGDASMSWQLDNMRFTTKTIATYIGDYVAAVRDSGTMIATLRGTYDLETYPDPKVTVEWKNATTYTMYWNGLMTSGSTY